MTTTVGLLALLTGCNDNSVKVLSEPPQVTIYSPSDGASYYEGQTIEAWAEIVTFDGSSPDTVEVRWVANEATVCEPEYAAGDGISTCSFVWEEPGEISLTATGTDPRGDKASSTVILNVLDNEAPSVTIVSPEDGAVVRENGNYMALEATISDLEDDPQDLTIELTSSVDGVLASGENGSSDGSWSMAATLSNGPHLIKVKVVDTVGKTSEDSITVYAGNTAPSIDSVLLDPNPATTVDDLACIPQGWQDDEGDPERYRFRWMINGAEDTSQTSDVLPYSATVRGDTVQCWAEPYDDYDDGEQVASATITIANGVPSDPTVVIDPNAPQPEENLTCVASGSIDPDGDAVTYVYAWSQNGTLTGHTSQVVTADMTVHLDTWTCDAYATDGELNSATLSDTVTVEDTQAPDAPTLDSLDAYRNSTDVEVTGLCEANCNLTYYFTDSSGSWTDVGTCSSTGTLSYILSLTRGDETDVYADCEDAAANISGYSNTVTTIACDPEDTYEAVVGYGDSGGYPINEWATIPDDGTSLSFEGTILNSSDEDWYVFTTSDASDGYFNDYDFAVDLTAGSGIYTFNVYEGGYGSTNLECSSTYANGYTEYNDFQEDSGDGSHTIPTATCTDGSFSTPWACACASSSSVYNECTDMSNTYYIEVLRDVSGGASCDYYELTISNAL